MRVPFKTLALGCMITTSTLLSHLSIAAPSVSAQKMADAIFAVVEADRAVYTHNVVDRLQNKEEVIMAEERWKEEQALPLPAQMLRMGAERVAEKDVGFTYSLLSLWPINQQNKPKTPLETKGLKAINKPPHNTFYGEEKLGAVNYFTAVYPDITVSQACVTCHNEHDDSPRDDFELNEVMGAVVIRIPLN